MSQWSVLKTQNSVRDNPRELHTRSVILWRQIACTCHRICLRGNGRHKNCAYFIVFSLEK